ncbi:MAG: copper oxidase [Verrucomicrobia bacterium]|nr:MAG: copper oxidase [Verrucomicrobiota bacterium]
MNSNCTLKASLLIAITTIGALRAAPTETRSESETVKLFARESTITVLGRKAKVAALTQSNEEQGYSPEEVKGFHVEVVNQLPVPTSIHWHGLVLPNLMDGVPFVTQDPIPPGGSRRYNFPLQQSGSYWMHSHYGLQEQQLLSAPMVIRSPKQSKAADAEFTVMLSDFSFTSSKDILKGLTGKKSAMNGKNRDTMSDSQPMSTAGQKESLVVQQWDETSKRLVAREVQAAAPDIDVKYNALLANRRTIDDPQVFEAKPGQSVLLRLMAAASATNFFIDTGKLDATIVATDGEDVQPLKGNFFQLSLAQRLDLLVTIPETGGVFPILALGEGASLQTGVLLSTPGTKIPKRPLALRPQRKMGGLDNTQEIHLRAKEPLADKPVQRSLPSVLGGDMMTYTWTINGATYPNRNSLNVKEGERVELVILNKTGMSHPMHLHGHVFEVTEIDGQKITGAKRDTILIPPKSTIKVAFDANNPGVWAYHCHILYHLATGMFTVLKYENADTKYWRPDGTPSELENPLELNNATAFWKEMTVGLIAPSEPAISR